MNRSANDKQTHILPVNYVACAHDVICGRGSACFHHVGNVRFRSLVMSHLDSYEESPSKFCKTRIICEVINTVHQQGGIFVKLDLENRRYYEVSKFHAVSNDTSCSSQSIFVISLSNFINLSSLHTVHLCDLKQREKTSQAFRAQKQAQKQEQRETPHKSSSLLQLLQSQKPIVMHGNVAESAEFFASKNFVSQNTSRKPCLDLSTPEHKDGLPYNWTLSSHDFRNQSIDEPWSCDSELFCGLDYFSDQFFINKVKPYIGERNDVQTSIQENFLDADLEPIPIDMHNFQREYIIPSAALVPNILYSNGTHTQYFDIYGQEDSSDNKDITTLFTSSSLDQRPYSSTSFDCML